MPGEYAKTRQMWETGYDAPNVESFVFRFFGRILKPEFGITSGRILDFGCGQGAAVAYFDRLGFDAYGVDISEKDIGIAKTRHATHLAELDVIDPKPVPGQKFRGAPFDCIITIQTLYYMNSADMDVAIANLADNLRPGGVFYATMMSEKHHHFTHAGPIEADGTRKVAYDNPRAGHREFQITFMASEDELRQRFRMFTPKHIGWYGEKLRSDEADRHHYTFVGVKP